MRTFSKNLLQETNRLQFSMVYNLINHRNEMFKTQVETQAAGQWFHCKVLNILWRHFYGL